MKQKKATNLEEKLEKFKADALALRKDVIPIAKAKDNKWSVEVMQVTEYKGATICIRHIQGSSKSRDRLYGDLFEYIVFSAGKIYSSNIVITPAKGKNKLNQGEILSAFRFIFAGALTTIDTLLEKETEMKKLIARKSEKEKEVDELVDGIEKEVASHS